MQTEKIRLTALDGLRGIAILAVIFNHIPLGILYQSLPKTLHFLLDIFLVNGKTGVSILFILTGFLMSWLHPKPKSSISFWSRRYARLFPSFLVMVVSWTIIKGSGKLSILQELGIVLVLAVIGRIFWEVGLFLRKKFDIGKWLTIFWISVQIVCALAYVFFLVKVPSSVFYQVWKPAWQLLTTALVNATLTLPFGNYIGQLDGVYWSLITETLFYLFYPLLFVPIFLYINSKKSKILKILLFLSIFPFSFGLHLVGQNFLSFGMIVPQLVVYFVIGVMIGSNLSWFKEQAEKIPKILLRPILVLPFLFLIFSSVVLYQFVPKLFEPYVQIFLSLPIGLLIVVLSFGEKYWGKLLEKKWLVFLGKYSYSLYLTHALCTSLAVRLIVPSSIFSAILLTLLSLFLSIILSWCLFQLVEKPYYGLGKSQAKVKEKLLEPIVSFKKPIVGFSIVILLISYWAYRPPVSLFTFVYPFGSSPFLSLFKGESKISLSDKPVGFNFSGAEEGLGMMMFHLTGRNSEETTGLLGKSELSIRLKNSEDQVIYQSLFNPGVIVNSRFHPFGFPIIPNSKGNNYKIELQMAKDSPVKSDLITTEQKFLTVYFLNKNELFRNPGKLFWWIFAKMREPFLNPSFWFGFINLAPIIVLLLASLLPLFKPKRAN